VPAIAEQIIGGENHLLVGETLYGQTKTVPRQDILQGRGGADFLFFQGNWAPLFEMSQNSRLEPLGKSTEIKVFRGFDATYSQYLILPNKFLQDPVLQPETNTMKFTIRNLPLDDAKNSSINIPSDYLKPCLRDARAHGSMLEETSEYWLLLVPKNAEKETSDVLRERYLLPIESLLEKGMHQKAKQGGKETYKERQNWYFHPSTYFNAGTSEERLKPRDLTGHVWTFNRYGLWRRNNVAVFSRQAVTGNHGCYTYYLTALDLKGQSELVWMILCAWFNSTWYLGTLLQQAKIPAKHVQQVNLAEHRQMLVPRFKTLLENDELCQEISQRLLALHYFLENHEKEHLPEQMRACFNNPDHPRVMLDRAWAKYLDTDTKDFWLTFREMYEKFENLILSR
jgi:hypothetical protein